ncbi:MAG: hypothetical protein EBS97_06215, partial [Verrucomicrobia bacterium]|nr:hypothetical protein [Verrucomicrobiota bacterium]
MISNWPTAAPITYGQAVSNSVLSGGAANPTGNFTWTVPTNRPNAGTNSQNVTFTPTATNNYSSVSTNISLVVNKATPALTWTPSPAAGLTYPAPLSSPQLNASSTVAGSWSYNPTNGSVLNAGTNTLVGTFTPTDVTNYTSGVTITNTVVVAKGGQNIIFGALPIKYVGDAAFSLTATASSGLTVTYTSSNTNVATVLGSLVTIVGEGTTTITASQAGNSNWNAAASVTQTLTIQPAINRGLIAYYPFNGNANDESGNGRNGTVSGAALTTDRLGNSNRAYFFNGSNSLISCQLTNLSIRQKTFSAWVYVDPVSQGGGGVAGLQTVGGAVFDTIVYNETSQGWGFGSDGWTRSGWSGVKETAPRWVHMAATYTNNQYRLYQNGYLILTTTNFSANVFSNAQAIIGMRHTGGGIPYLRGSIDEVRFYDRVLSVAEIGQLYQQEVGNMDTDGDGLTDAWERGYGRYQRVNQAFTWAQAKADAEARGGHLATITSQAEKEMVHALVSDLPAWGPSHTWLGGYKNSSGQWGWTTGEAWKTSADEFMPPWYPGQPDNSGGNQDALIIEARDLSKWDDYPGSWSTSYYILEFGYPTDPAKADTDGDG